MLSYLRSYSPSPVAELYRVFGVKRSTLTSMLDRLESRGWVARETSRRDRRVVLVSLKPEGRSRADRIQRAVEALEERIAAQLTREQMEGFYAVMSAVAAATNVVVTDRDAGGTGGS